MPGRGLTPTGGALRFVFAGGLIFSSYNPEGVSYYHWALLEPSAFDPIKGLVGIALLVGWTVYLRATFRSLGSLGMLLAIAFFAMLVWSFVYYGWIVADSRRALTYLGMFVLAGVISAGMSWSLVRRKLTGQVDVDDVGDS